MGCYEGKLVGWRRQAEEVEQSFEGITCLNRSELKLKLNDFSKLLTEFFSA